MQIKILTFVNTFRFFRAGLNNVNLALMNFFVLFLFLQYFETDDEEFYKTKVCFILNNDVSEMDLVFAEEKYSKSGQLEKVAHRNSIIF